jgi:uncharacterized SAM-binding protein YcdF (DUF218 family)
MSKSSDKNKPIHISTSDVKYNKSICPSKINRFIVVLGYNLSLINNVPTLGPINISRLNRAYEIYLESPCNTKIICSGGDPQQYGVSQAQLMSQYLLNKGVCPQNVTEENKSLNTIENLTNVRSILTGINQPYKLIIVSSNFHTPRIGLLLYNIFTLIAPSAKISGAKTPVTDQEFQQFLKEEAYFMDQLGYNANLTALYKSLLNYLYPITLVTIRQDNGTPFNKITILPIIKPDFSFIINKLEVNFKLIGTCKNCI